MPNAKLVLSCREVAQSTEIYQSSLVAHPSVEQAFDCLAVNMSTMLVAMLEESQQTVVARLL